MRTVTVRLDSDLADWLEQAAVKSGVSQGNLIRDQLEKARDAAGEQSLVQPAASVRGPKDLSSRKGFYRP